MSVRVEKGTVVTLSYRLTTEDGELLEDRPEKNPFTFTYGEGQTIPAIESVILGKTEGFQASLGIDAQQAYGEYRDELVITLPREHFPKNVQLKEGMHFSTRDEDGRLTSVRIVEVLADAVRVDGNHPLAGLSIFIDLKLLKVKEPSSSENEDERTDPTLH